MIRTLLDVIPAGNRKYPIRYRRSINILYSRLDYLKFKFLGMDMTNSPGLLLIKALLEGADLNEIDSYQSDLDRFIYVIQSYKQSRLTQFDPVYSGKFTSGYFSSGQSSYAGITEILLDVDTAHPLNTLPLEKDWSEWQYLRGLRVVSHDSLEIPETITSSLITFNKDAPTILVMTIDIPVLLFKYYKYWKNCKEAEIECTVVDFLKRYEYANFFGDLLDAWVLNLFPFVFTASGQNMTVNEVVKELTVPTRVATDNVLREVVNGLFEYATLYQQNSLKPQDFVDTPWMPNNQSFREKILDYCDRVQFPQQRNYLWCKALFWMPYVDIITSSLVVFPSSPVSNQIAVKARNLWRSQFKFSNMSSIARGVAVKTAAAAIGGMIEELTKERAG